MRNKNRRLIFVILPFFLWLVFPRRAYAYLDPGTGSYFFQLAMGLLVGAIFALKIYWKKVSSFMANLFSRESKDKKDGS